MINNNTLITLLLRLDGGAGRTLDGFGDHGRASGVGVEILGNCASAFSRFSSGFHPTSLKVFVFTPELIILIVLPIDLLNLSAGQCAIVNAYIVNVTIEKK